MKRFLTARIMNGEFISSKYKFRQLAASMPDGDYLHLLIKRSDRTARESQNFYFLQLGEWVNDTGYTKMELHDIVKFELFAELFGEPISSSHLNEDQWEIVFLNLETFLIIKFENHD